MPKARSQTAIEPPWPDALAGIAPGWIEWGGERIFAVGFTSGGAPFGLRADEMDEDDGPGPPDNDYLRR